METQAMSISACEVADIDNHRELYNRAKKDPSAIVWDVGEKHPFIIHEAHVLCTMVDGSEENKVVYVTFEYVKKHLKAFKRCTCETCRNIVTAYRINRKAMRGEQVEIPASWMREQ